MIRWSRIHANLGIDSADLTFEHIQAAVDARMPEAADLDWKKDHTGDPDEYAKDVAAMANRGGGLLVYRVAEERGTGRADGINGADNSEARCQSLRQVAASRIRPLVSGLDPISLTAHDGRTVLVLSVPRSADAPHAVDRGRNGLGFPYRDGTDIRWMSEAQLARAYADRFTLRETEHNRLLTVESRPRLRGQDRRRSIGSRRK